MHLSLTLFIDVPVPFAPGLACSSSDPDDLGPSCSNQHPSQRHGRSSSFSIHIDVSMDSSSRNSGSFANTERPNCPVKRSPRLRHHVKGKSFQIDINGKLQLQPVRAPLQRVENERRPMTRRRMAGKRKSMEDENGSDSVYYSL